MIKTIEKQVVELTKDDEMVMPFIMEALQGMDSLN